MPACPSASLWVCCVHVRCKGAQSMSCAQVFMLLTFSCALARADSWSCSPWCASRSTRFCCEYGLLFFMNMSRTAGSHMAADLSQKSGGPCSEACECVDGHIDWAIACTQVLAASLRMYSGGTTMGTRKRREKTAKQSAMHGVHKHNSEV